MVQIIQRWPNYDIIDFDQLPRWDAISQTLKGSQKKKAEIFVREDLVSYDKEHHRFKILPIAGYNKTIYEVHNEHGELKCNCQWNVKNSLRCSHILAVLLWLKVGRELRGELT